MNELSNRLQKFLANRIVQYGIFSTFVGLANFFMIVSIYANQLLNLNPFLVAPMVILIVLVLSWLIVEKWGFIRTYYNRQHRRSPVFLEQLKNQNLMIKKLTLIEKRLEEIEAKEKGNRRAEG